MAVSKGQVSLRIMAGNKSLGGCTGLSQVDAPLERVDGRSGDANLRVKKDRQRILPVPGTGQLYRPFSAL